MNGTGSYLDYRTEITPAMLRPALVDPCNQMNDKHRLLQRIQILGDRKSYTIEFCKGKKVLHIGCVDTGRFEQTDETLKDGRFLFLHSQIAKVAEYLVGIDIDLKGVQWLKDAGYEAYRIDIEHDQEPLWRILKDVDTIIMPEVLEHLDNPGLALGNLRASGFDGDILITTPNAFSRAVAIGIEQGVEIVHEDHNFWFSPTTLKSLLNKYGFQIKEMLLYFWPTDDPIGRELREILPTKPYLAEGIIAIANRNEGER